MLGQVAPDHVADLLDPQPKQHPAERLAFGGLDRSHQLLRRDLAEARLRRDLLRREVVEVGGRPHPAEVHEQADLLLAETIDVHRAGEVLEQLPAPAGAVPIRAPGEYRALGLDGLGVADRAFARGVRRRRSVVSLGDVRRRTEDLGDHVARAQHDHVLALPDVLARQVLLVVERRHLHRDPAHAHRLEHRARVQVAELARGPHDLIQPGDGGGGRELPRDRPPRLAPNGPQPALELDLVDLDHDPVDLEIERAAPLLPCFALGDHLVFGPELLDIGVDREAVLAQPFQGVPVGVEADPLGGADPVGPQRQRPIGGELRIELANRPGRGVPGVHERGQAGLGSALVERGEIRQRHVHLPAHLYQRRRVRVLQPQRDGRDCPQVVGDVLADLTVAAGGAALEHAVAVDERDRQPVDLGLGDELELRVGDPLPREVVAHPLDPGLEVLGRVGVPQRQHRLRMANLLQLGDRLRRDALSG